MVKFVEQPPQSVRYLPAADDDTAARTSGSRTKEIA